MHKLFSIFAALGATLLAVLYILVLSGGLGIAGFLYDMNRKHKKAKPSLDSGTEHTLSMNRVNSSNNTNSSDTEHSRELLLANTEQSESKEDCAVDKIRSTNFLSVPTGPRRSQFPFVQKNELTRDIRQVVQMMLIARKEYIDGGFGYMIGDTLRTRFDSMQNILYIMIDGTFNTTQAREGMRMYSQSLLCPGIYAHSGLLRAYLDLRIRSRICSTILRERLSGKTDAKIVIMGYSRGAAFTAFFAAEEACAATRVVHGPVRFILCACPKVFDPESSIRLRQEPNYSSRVIVVNHVSDIIPQLPLGVSNPEFSGHSKAVAYAPMGQGIQTTIELYKCPELSAHSRSNSMRRIHSLEFYSDALLGPHRISESPIVKVPSIRIRDSHPGVEYERTRNCTFLFFKKEPCKKMKSD